MDLVGEERLGVAELQVIRLAMKPWAKYWEVSPQPRLTVPNPSGMAQGRRQLSIARLPETAAEPAACHGVSVGSRMTRPLNHETYVRLPGARVAQRGWLPGYVEVSRRSGDEPRRPRSGKPGQPHC
jgi:hypothetical protein